MIDWLKMRFPLPHPEPISAGYVESVNDQGLREWITVKRRPLKGSHAAQVNVRTCPHSLTQRSLIEFDGNPAKWVQGHNLWGSDDLFGIAVATCEAVALTLGLPISEEVRSSWLRGAIELFRVDVAQSYALDSRGQVLAWLRSAEQTAHLSHRGRGQLVKGTTLYFGQHSRRWSIKAYSKGEEIAAKGHWQTQSAILNLPSAAAWADPILRFELTLRHMELKRLSLNVLANWLPIEEVPAVVPLRLLLDRLGDMTMTTTASLSADVLATLRPSLRTAVQSWEAGNDLRLILSRPTFYRYRKELLPLGIDIATLLPKAGQSNIVPLHRVLDPQPVGVPDWAVGTPLYWEPRRYG